MICKKCGQGIEDHSNYCFNCGIATKEEKGKFHWFEGRSHNKIAKFLKIAAVIFTAMGFLYSLYIAMDIGYLGIETAEIYVSGISFMNLLSGFLSYALRGAILFGIGELIDVIDARFCGGKKL